MPPKAAYWKYFNREGNKAQCSIGGCKNPTVSLGKEAVEGQKKPRTGKGTLKNYIILEGWVGVTKRLCLAYGRGVGDMPKIMDYVTGAKYYRLQMGVCHVLKF